MLPVGKTLLNREAARVLIARENLAISSAACPEEHRQADPHDGSFETARASATGAERAVGVPVGGCRSHRIYLSCVVTVGSATDTSGSCAESSGVTAPPTIGKALKWI